MSHSATHSDQRYWITIDLLNRGLIVLPHDLDPVFFQQILLDMREQHRQQIEQARALVASICGNTPPCSLHRGATHADPSYFVNSVRLAPSLPPHGERR